MYKILTSTDMKGTPLTSLRHLRHVPRRMQPVARPSRDEQPILPFSSIPVPRGPVHPALRGHPVYPICFFPMTLCMQRPPPKSTNLVAPLCIGEVIFQPSIFPAKIAVLRTTKHSTFHISTILSHHLGHSMANRPTQPHILRQLRPQLHAYYCSLLHLHLLPS